MAREAKTQWKQGWRVVGGQRIFFRSRWEANYARYLETLIESRDIIGWKHEPETFWFDVFGIRRGVNSYKPDFKIYLCDGSHEWHEVKGWMDDRSRLTIKRFRRFYPQEPMRVIAAEQYEELERTVAPRILDWEWPEDRKLIPVERRVTTRPAPTRRPAPKPPAPRRSANRVV